MEENRKLKCVECGLPAIAGYHGKSYCKKHYIKYLKNAHGW